MVHAFGSILCPDTRGDWHSIVALVYISTTSACPAALTRTRNSSKQHREPFPTFSIDTVRGRDHTCSGIVKQPCHGTTPHYQKSALGGAGPPESNHYWARRPTRKLRSCSIE